MGENQYIIREILDHVDSLQETLLCTGGARDQVFPLISFLLLFIFNKTLFWSLKNSPLLLILKGRGQGVGEVGLFSMPFCL